MKAVEKEEKHMKDTNVGRSYKEVVVGMQHHPNIDGRMSKKQNNTAVADDGEDETKLDRMNIKGMVSKVVEEILRSTNLKEAKRKITIMIEEPISVIKRNENFWVDEADQMKEEMKNWLEGEDEQLGVFLEEELIFSMLHEDQHQSDSFTGHFEFSLAVEASSLLCPEARPMEKCREEASRPLGPNLRNTSLPPVTICGNELGRGESKRPNIPTWL